MRRRQRSSVMEGGPLASSTGHFKVRDWPGGKRSARRVSGLVMLSIFIFHCSGGCVLTIVNKSGCMGALALWPESWIIPTMAFVAARRSTLARRVHGRMAMFPSVLKPVLAAFAAAAALPAQTMMQGSGPAGAVRIFHTDSAMLESQESRKDLPCTVTSVKPIVGFDMKFHTGYDVSVPLRELAGSENLLTMVFRVSPANRPDEPVYFSQRITVPSIDENAKGD